MDPGFISHLPWNLDKSAHDTVTLAPRSPDKSLSKTKLILGFKCRLGTLWLRITTARTIQWLRLVSLKMTLYFDSLQKPWISFDFLFVFEFFTAFRFFISRAQLPCLQLRLKARFGFIQPVGRTDFTSPKLNEYHGWSYSSNTSKLHEVDKPAF